LLLFAIASITEMFWLILLPEMLMSSIPVYCWYYC